MSHHINLRKPLPMVRKGRDDSNTVQKRRLHRVLIKHLHRVIEILRFDLQRTKILLQEFQKCQHK